MSLNTKRFAWERRRWKCRVGLKVLDGMEWSINHFAGESVRKKVMQRLDGVSSKPPLSSALLQEIAKYNSDREVARWVKGAMERLDALVDEPTRMRIMEECGRMCAGVNRRDIEEAIAKRKKYRNIDEFLEAEARSLGIVREEDVSYLVYMPCKQGIRCHCLGKDLPIEETMSRTYCQCSVGFVRKYWEDVLERPVKVELIHSAISGGRECKFAIYS